MAIIRVFDKISRNGKRYPQTVKFQYDRNKKIDRLLFLNSCLLYGVKINFTSWCSKLLILGSSRFFTHSEKCSIGMPSQVPNLVNVNYAFSLDLLAVYILQRRLIHGAITFGKRDTGRFSTLA